VVLALGITPDLEGEENPFSCEGFVTGDKTTLALPATQRALLAAVAALGKPVTVVLTTGSALSFDPAHANAILLAWYYGQRGGDAIAEALVGEVNPAGRLPITFYCSEADLPPFADYGMDGRTYRYFEGLPLYAFGHGLSYTTFVYNGLDYCSETRTAHVRITNKGARSGDEVVQLYVRDPRPGRPRLQLCGFLRVSLGAGQEKTVIVPIDTKPLRRWDEATLSYVLDPVPRELLAGGASDSLPLLTELTVV